MGRVSENCPKEKDRDGAVLLGWTGDNGDPDNFLAVLLGCDGVGGSNRAQWCNKEFEDLIQKAKIVSDKAERTKLYEDAQVVFKREAPWATIAPFSGVHADVEKGIGLCDGSAGRSLVRRCGYRRVSPHR